MSDFYNDPKIRKAHKNHRCTYCGEPIQIGASYSWQKGNFDGSWYESKFHFECADDLAASGDNEYTPYCNDRPCAEVAA